MRFPEPAPPSVLLLVARACWGAGTVLNKSLLASLSPTGSRAVVVTALGVTQIFAWGCSYYLIAVLAEPIAVETGWARAWIVGGVSLGLLTAGAISPWVGRAIAALGGRPVLAASAGLLATGLVALGLAQSLPVYVAAWLVIGFGMGAGLYDPAFATLGRLYGHSGRSAITTLTLFGGFASTICWPLSAFLEAHLGWRGACAAYAGFQLFVALPIYLLVVPREPRQPAHPPEQKSPRSLAPRQAGAAAAWAVGAACRDHHTRLSHLDNSLGALAFHLASRRVHASLCRSPRRACWAVAGGGQSD